MQHLVRFNAKISWEGRMNGLPEVVHTYVIFQGNGPGLVQAIYDHTKTIVSMHGITVEKEPGKMSVFGKVSNNAMYIPMQWIVFMDVDILPMSGEMPIEDANGVPRLSDGKEPVKQ
jgi:hypothetical protein